MARTPSIRYAASKALLGGTRRLFLYHSPSLATLSLHVPQLQLAIFEATPADPELSRLCHHLRVVNNPAIRLVGIFDDKDLTQESIARQLADAAIPISALPHLPCFIDRVLLTGRPPQPNHLDARIRANVEATRTSSTNSARPPLTRIT